MKTDMEPSVKSAFQQHKSLLVHEKKKKIKKGNQKSIQQHLYTEAVVS